MDYVARQFVFLAKKFRKELRPLIAKLNNALDKHTEAIHQSTQAAKQQQTPPPEVTVHTHFPESIEIHQNAQEASDERNYRRVTFLVAGLTLGAIVAYSVLVFLQYREMIGATTAAQQSAKAAHDAAEVGKESLYAVQRAFVIFPDKPEIDYFVDKHFFVFTMPLENTGVTPARALKDRVSCETRMGPLPSNFTFPDKQGVCGNPWAATGANVIAAKGRRGVSA